MSQHVLQQHDIEDQRIMRRLGMVVGCFIAATAAMAIAIAVVMGSAIQAAVCIPHSRPSCTLVGSK